MATVTNVWRFQRAYCPNCGCSVYQQGPPDGVPQPSYCRDCDFPMPWTHTTTGYRVNLTVDNPKVWVV